MTVDEEILYFKVAERIAADLVNKFLYQKNEIFFSNDYIIQINDIYFNIEYYEGNIVLSVNGKSRVILASSSSSYINLYTKKDWCKNNSRKKDKAISFLNSDNDSLWEHETYIDSFFENGELCTPEQHFQFSLLHPELPEYDDMCKIHEVLMKKRVLPFGWDINVRMMHASLNDMLELETELLRRNK